MRSRMVAAAAAMAVVGALSAFAMGSSAAASGGASSIDAYLNEQLAELFEEGTAIPVANDNGGTACLWRELDFSGPTLIWNEVFLAGSDNTIGYPGGRLIARRGFMGADGRVDFMGGIPFTTAEILERCHTGEAYVVGEAPGPVDSDGDGVPDDEDAFPDDPSEWADSDGDGVGDNADAYPNSALSATVTIDGVDLGVPNADLGGGATMLDVLSAAIAAEGTGGEVQSSVSALLNEWKAAGLISGRDQGRITSAVAKTRGGKR